MSPKSPISIVEIYVKRPVSAGLNELYDETEALLQLGSVGTMCPHQTERKNTQIEKILEKPHPTKVPPSLPISTGVLSCPGPVNMPLMTLKRHPMQHRR